MSMFDLRLAGALLLLALFCGKAVAHGDLHDQIQAVAKQIETDPGNAALYLKRGELHRAHREWDAAQADYDRALELSPGLEIVDIARGKMFLEAGWPLSAEAALNRFLSRHTNHAEALIVRARTRAKLGSHLAAAADYTGAIAQERQPGPELFIERAQALIAAGKPHYDDALQGLDEGVRRLGPLVTLQLYAIDLEVKQGRIDQALARLDQLAAKSPRKETWLARRGEILLEAGRTHEAHAAFQAALKAMNSLPPSRRRVPAMIELEKRLMLALETIRQAAETSKGRKNNR